MAKSFPVIEPKEGLKQKGLTRAILKDYQITFNENVYSRDPAPPESSDKAVSAHSTKQDASRSDPLPVHIEEVRRRLLDFKSIVPSSKKTGKDFHSPYRKDLPPKDSPIYYEYAQDANGASLYPTHPTDLDRAHRKNFDLAVEMVTLFIEESKCESVPEADYSSLWRKMFEKWDGNTRAWLNPTKRNKNDRIASGTDTYLFTAAHEVRKKTRSRIASSAKIPTIPKPDFWFAFPINGATDLSMKTLLYLEETIGLYSCPLMSLRRATLFRAAETDTVYDKKHVCYPWAIVEVKPRDETRAQFCYCQAANGGSTSLSMLEHLSKHRRALHHQAKIPPIVCFTVIGHKTKLWLAYTKSLYGTDSWCDTWSSEHYMQCIWEGDLVNLQDLIKVYRILDIMIYWAVHEFRPWVKSQLSCCDDRIQEELNKDGNYLRPSTSGQNNKHESPSKQDVVSLDSYAEVNGNAKINGSTNTEVSSDDNKRGMLPTGSLQTTKNLATNRLFVKHIDYCGSQRPITNQSSPNLKPIRNQSTVFGDAMAEESVVSCSQAIPNIFSSSSSPLTTLSNSGYENDLVQQFHDYCQTEKTKGTIRLSSDAQIFDGYDRAGLNLQPLEKPLCQDHFGLSKQPQYNPEDVIAESSSYSPIFSKISCTSSRKIEPSTAEDEPRGTNHIAPHAAEALLGPKDTASGFQKRWVGTNWGHLSHLDTYSDRARGIWYPDLTWRQGPQSEEESDEGNTDSALNAREINLGSQTHTLKK